MFVAIAPTYPESDEDDLRATLEAAASLEPVTIFHEPINIRAENIDRIRSHAESLGVELNTDVFASRQSWRTYAVGQLEAVERLSHECGVADRLHLWPDQSLGSKEAVAAASDPVMFQQWLQRCWTRVSEWPR